MKYPETNIPSYTEAQPLEAEAEHSPKRFALLRKVGGKVLDVTPTTAALYGMSHSYDPSLPPQYTIPASVVGGLVMDQGIDKLKSIKEKRKAKKNPPENPETTETGASVV